MELDEFLRATQAEVRAEIGDRLIEPDGNYPFPESVFAEVVMQHMSEIGMTFEPIVCHFSATVGNAIVRISGYAVSEEADQLDLFVSLYEGVDEVQPIADSKIKKAAEQCLRFFAKCAQGTLAAKMDQSNDAYDLAVTIQNVYQTLYQIRVYVLTDQTAKSRNFKPREVKGKTVKLEVMDIERLHRHWSEGKPRDEVVVDFEEVSGGALPCIYVPGELGEYDYALTVIPGEALQFVYEKYGPRLLEANVRSFLSVTGKVNRGIRDTLKGDPERFMAYNNGIVIVADELNLGKTSEGGPGILWLKGMQIVNGGQTTAAIYFAKKKNPEVDLAKVRVTAKIVVLKTENPAEEEALISDISKFANSQNSVRQSDLSANKPFHVEVEKLASTTFCPDGVGRWFYERAAGSYKTMLTREGTTPARLKKLKQAIPPARKFTKTDLAKFINAWEQLPDAVSFGAQKNFMRFMDGISEREATSLGWLPDVAAFKEMVAKAILFKATQKLVRPMFPAFQANIASYTVSIVANRLGAKMDLGAVWLKQDISDELKGQIRTWAEEVHNVLYDSSQGRMISEWAKKPECWTVVREAEYSAPLADIPETQ